jgi:uncharacterized membrane protein
MTAVILYLSTFVLFLALDYAGLSYIVKPVFERAIGPLMLENFRVLPAFAFYAFFIAVLLWFVSWPALAEGKTLLWVFGNAALIGALGYGTYEFTNLAILKDWAWEMVRVDVIWGTCLTAVAATGGVWITRTVVSSVLP